MSMESLAELEAACKDQDIFDVILNSDCVERGVTREESFEKMREVYNAIRRAAGRYNPALRSASGMVGGDGAKMRAYVAAGNTLCGDYIGQVITQALEMGENNACMKCIVAAPTAGSCGVLPAVLLPYQQREELDDDAMVRALYVAALSARSSLQKPPSPGRRRLPGGNRHSQRHGCQCVVLFMRRRCANHLPCRGNRLKKSYGIGLRPNRRFGGGAMR